MSKNTGYKVALSNGSAPLAVYGPRDNGTYFYNHMGIRKTLRSNQTVIKGNLKGKGPAFISGEKKENVSSGRSSSSNMKTEHSVSLSDGRILTIYGPRQDGTFYYNNGGKRRTLAANQIVYSNHLERSVGRGKNALERSLKEGNAGKKKAKKEPVNRKGPVNRKEGPDILGPREFNVANAYGSSVDKNLKSWKAKWVNITGRQWPKACQLQGCDKAAAVGGHMHVQLSVGSWDHDNNFYILPICYSHNSNKRLDCGNERCSKFIKTNGTAVLARVDQQYIHAFRENDRQHQRSASGSYSGRKVDKITSVKKLVEIVNGNHGDCSIIFTMTDCVWCPPRFDKFARTARASSLKHFHFHDLDEESYEDEIGVESYPTVLRIRNGKISDIT